MATDNNVRFGAGWEAKMQADRELAEGGDGMAKMRMQYYWPGSGDTPAAGGGGGSTVPGSEIGNVGAAGGAVADTMNSPGIQGSDAFSGLMAASGGNDFKYLGTQANQLRPLGQRMGVQDSLALAGLQKRVY